MFDQEDHEEEREKNGKRCEVTGIWDFEVHNLREEMFV